MATTAVNFGAHLWTRVELGSTTGAFSSGDTYDLINYCQKVLCVGRALVVATGTFTYTSGNAIYTISSAVSTSCARIISLYKTTKTAMRVGGLDELRQYDLNWYAASSSGGSTWFPKAWCQLGEDTLVVYPKPASGGTLSCAYVKNPGLIDEGTDTLEIADKDLPLLYDLCEIILLVHLRRLTEAGMKVVRLEERLGIGKK
jgi:hypothetical protein